jgi:F-type H+-transporting ATPase subunit b
MKRSSFLFAFALFASFCCLCAVAQQSAPAAKAAPNAQKTAPASAPAEGSKTGSAFAPESANSNQELTHASNEAAGRTPGESGVGSESGAGESEEQEQAAFKYSPAVQGISHISRLPLEGAYWLCVVINFAIIAGLIILGLKSNLPAMFRGRTQEIQKGMEEARRSSEEARRKLQDIEARLSRMSVEIGEMQKHADAEAKAEEGRIRASIAEEKQKILDAAQHEITQSTNTARRDLQKYAVDLAVAMAEKGIRVDTGEDKSLVEEFTEQLGSQARRNGNG